MLRSGLPIHAAPVPVRVRVRPNPDMIDTELRDYFEAKLMDHKKGRDLSEAWARWFKRSHGVAFCRIDFRANPATSREG